MVNSMAKAPHYVLKNGLLSAVPLVSNSSQRYCSEVIFGFSDKAEYDVFKSSSVSPLTPYPLVNEYLKGRIEADPDTLKLIVIDASSLQQKVMQAVTFQAALAASRRGDKTVQVTHQLVLDEATSTFSIESLSDTSLEHFLLPIQPDRPGKTFRR